MFLRGTNVNPSMVISPVDLIREKNKEHWIHRDRVHERLEKYQAFLGTEIGQIVSRLVDPMIAHCDYELSRSSVELGMSVEQAREHKDMLVGERRVWMRMKVEPEALRKELEELDVLLGDREQEGKAGWSSPPKVKKEKS